MNHAAESFVVSGILMHGYANNALQDREYLLLCVLAFFIFDIFVPEWVGKKVETNICRSSLEKPGVMLVLVLTRTRAEEERGAGIIHRRVMLNL